MQFPNLISSCANVLACLRSSLRLIFICFAISNNILSAIGVLKSSSRAELNLFSKSEMFAVRVPLSIETPIGSI